MHSVLSPLAKPFQPIEFAIFNDGVPSSVYYGSHPEHEVLMHIEDDAIDETFPPSASDVSSALVLFACFYDADVHLMSMQIWAWSNHFTDTGWHLSHAHPNTTQVAEIEAAEAYVDLMAWLSFLDEHEESARLSFAGYKKRWESRRAAGLLGKPHSARATALAAVIAKAAAAHSGEVNLKETDIVPFSPKPYEVSSATGYKKAKEFAKVHPKNFKGVHGHGNPIQQPRKHNWGRSLYLICNSLSFFYVCRYPE